MRVFFIQFPESEVNNSMISDDHAKNFRFCGKKLSSFLENNPTKPSLSFSSSAANDQMNKILEGVFKNFSGLQGKSQQTLQDFYKAKIYYSPESEISDAASIIKSECNKFVAQKSSEDLLISSMSDRNAAKIFALQIREDEKNNIYDIIVVSQQKFISDFIKSCCFGKTVLSNTSNNHYDQPFSIRLIENFEDKGFI